MASRTGKERCGAETTPDRFSGPSADSALVDEAANERTKLARRSLFLYCSPFQRLEPDFRSAAFPKR